MQSPPECLREPVTIPVFRFMVERGHDDGCGTDAMVNYEYAKVRRLYAKLGLVERTTIEHFDGPHTIHGVGTFAFLKEKLGWK